MPIKFYNTLSKKIDEFKPISPQKVKIYVCGPTVYDYFHIGNARSFIMSDIIQRYFRYRGFEVTFVMNLTDIDDKIIKKANQQNCKSSEIAGTYSEAFFQDLKKLKVRLADHYPRATENIEKIISLVLDLEKKGIAYNADGDVYFNTTKFNEYGKLSGKNLDELLDGARVDVNEKKKNPSDFALWKSAKPGEPFWESPWGQGRPGWHIECSAMSMGILGETFDIHAGGNDLIFPHHENEIAQSEASTGKTFANYWIHFGFLNIDNEKMSKSLGNFHTAREVLKSFSAEAVRLLFSQSLYSAPLNFSFENLTGAENAVTRIRNSYHLFISAEKREESQEIFSLQKYLDAFNAAFENNLNSPEAVAVMFEFIKDFNTFIARNNFLNPENEKIIHEGFSSLCNQVLGVLDMNKPEEADDSLADKLMTLIIDIRNKVRAEKRYDIADLIRKNLDEIGIIIEDKKGATSWKKNKR